MIEIRLIDANSLKKKSVPYIRGDFGYRAKSEDWAVLVKDINNTPTIDPETLPIVQELRDKLKNAEEERNKYKNYLDIATQNIADLTGTIVKVEEERDKAIEALDSWFVPDGMEE